MTMEGRTSEFPGCVEETRRIWNANAAWWDDQIGDGNAFQEVLIEPATERLLGVEAGDRVLDVACGAGRMARRFAELGASVVGIDLSERFIERARERSEAEGVAVEYRVLDAGDGEAMLELGAGSFDRAACTMALMDMPCVEPVMRSVARLLKPGGRFVFSVIHPCFQSAGAERFVETYADDAGRHAVRNGVKVWRYLRPEARKAEGIVGQPKAQYYFHRPLEALLGVGFRAGFVVEGLAEPGFPRDAVEAEGLRWLDLCELPPVLVVGMRLGGREDR